MREMKKTVIFLGPPGSGKGTQAQKIARRSGLPHISTGDLFRAHLKQGSDLGKTAKEYLNSGNLVPDSLVLEMVFDRVSKKDCSEGYLLDGFPRTVPQAEAYEKSLEQQNGSLAVINIQISDDEVIRRLSNRLTCRQCGHIQHKIFSPPQQEKVCDRCGAELYQRSDDRPEVIAQRLKNYYEQTAPLIEFYQQRGKLLDIGGKQAPEVVCKKILEKLQESLKI